MFPDAIDDTFLFGPDEAGGDTDGNVLANDVTPGGETVSEVNGSPANVGVPVAGTNGGLITINADGTFDFDANGDFGGLAPGNSTTTEFTYAITFTGAAPVVDVILFQDLSASFFDDLPNVQAQFSGLFDSLNAVRDVQFGVSSFIDKPISPFGGAGDYVYQTELAVTDDKAAIQAALDGLVLGFGDDFPEAQIEGLFHLALRADTEVGFRPDAQRIVVLQTDAPPHVAGDFAAAGPNDGDADIETEDYPTVAQLKQALEDAGIIPVFSVTASQIATYEQLVADLGRGVVVELEPDSANLAQSLIDLFEDGLVTTDTATVTVEVEAPEEPGIDIDIDASKVAEFDIDLSFDTDIDYTSDLDVSSTYDVDVDIAGNDATFNIDVQAFGEDTSTALDLVVVTLEDEWSSILATGYSAVDGFA